MLSLAWIGSSPTAATAQLAQTTRGAHARATPVAHEVPTIAVTWTFRDRDIYACESAAYDLRALLRAHGDRVTVHAVAVDADRELVASWLRRERLDVDVRHLSSQQYRQAFRTDPVPGVAVTQQGRLVENLNTGQLQVRGRRDTRSLAAIVEGLLATGTRYSLLQR